jgi:hypothetical protein
MAKPWRQSGRHVDRDIGRGDGRDQERPFVAGAHRSRAPADDKPSVIQLPAARMIFFVEAVKETADGERDGIDAELGLSGFRSLRSVIGISC